MLLNKNVNYEDGCRSFMPNKGQTTCNVNRWFVVDIECTVKDMNEYCHMLDVVVLL